MKKVFALLVATIIITCSIFQTHALNKSQVDKVLDNFYIKLERNTTDVDKRIKKLETIINRIESVEISKWNRLSSKSKTLLSLLKSNISNKITQYKESQKEEININEILWNIGWDITSINKSGNTYTWNNTDDIYYTIWVNYGSKDYNFSREIRENSVNLDTQPDWVKNNVKQGINLFCVYPSSNDNAHKCIK